MFKGGTEDQVSRMKIRRRHQLVDERVSRRVFHPQQHPYALHFLGGQLLFKERVNGEVWLQVAVLWQSGGLSIRPYSDGDRWPVQMKQRMDKLTPRKYLPNFSSC